MTLLSVKAGQERIISRFKPVESETLPLSQCAGRVLASDIISSDLPLFDNSSVDGFAVVAADLSSASPNAGRSLQVIADIPAGLAIDIGSSVAASPARLTELTVLWPPSGSMAVIPSKM